MITLNESNQTIKSEIIRYIDNDDIRGLTNYLKSMPDDTICKNPFRSNEEYYKASNGVKSGWSWKVNGKRKNIVLFHDDEVAKDLMRWR